ncbi:MAG TPA: hypothetical protein VNJ09_02255 [Chthonomonadales bacterium]|nr:hypothetical protein [Chthonomonadales bacterium]
MLTLTIALSALLIAPASAQIGPPIGPPPVTVYPAPMDPYLLAQPSDGYTSAYEADSLLSVQEVALAPVFWPWFGAWRLAVGFPEQPWASVEAGLLIPTATENWRLFCSSNL